MKIKLLSRLLCALLSVLMLVCMIPAITVSASTAGTPTLDPSIDYTRVEYESAEARFEAMTPMYDNGEYSLRCDTLLGIVAYRKNATGEILFTNPYTVGKKKDKDEGVNPSESIKELLEDEATINVPWQAFETEYEG